MDQEQEIRVRRVRDDEISAWAHLTAATVDAVSGLSEAEIAAEFARATAHSRTTAHLAWLTQPGDGAQAIARLRLSLQGPHAQVWGLGLAAEVAARGLETAVLRAIEASAHAAGATSLLAQVVPDRAPMLTRAGYRLKKARVEMAADLDAPCCHLAALDRPVRHPCPDAESEMLALGRLYYEAYHGAIDDEGETPADALDEVRRCLGGEYGCFLADCSFVLEGDDGEPAGAVLVAADSDGSVLLAEVLMHPRYRGRGYARPLIQSAMNACLERGYRRMWLMVTHDNVPAEGLYRRLGFAEVAGSEVAHFYKELAA